jgi:hypothetical protein
MFFNFRKELANGLKFNFMAVEKWNESADSDSQKIHQVASPENPSPNDTVAITHNIICSLAYF